MGHRPVIVLVCLRERIIVLHPTGSSARVSVAVAAVVEGVREREGGRKKHVTHHNPETH